MLTQAQIALRRTGIGASELFDVLNNPYKLWHQKVTGKSPFTGKEDFIRVGNLFEKPTAEDYAYRRAQAGSPVRLLTTQTATGEPVTLQDPKRPWFRGTPDFLPALERVGGFPLFVPDVETIWRMRDAGQITCGLEIKTGAAVAERHLEEDDQWGQGYRAPIEDVILLLQDRCEDPMSVAKDLMARFSLQHHIGVEAAQSEEDQWGDPGTAQMPRRYLSQCVGYMAITGLDQWDLHRLRFGMGKLETVTYTIMRDAELESMLLDAAAKFVRDHLEPQKPPAQVELEDRQLELARIFPKENGVIRPATAVENGMLEQYRDAIIAAKRAEVEKEMIELAIKARIADFKGLEGSAGKVSYGWRKGRTSIDAHAAVQGLCDILQDELKGRVESAKLEAWAQQALAAATKEGEGFRAISRPQAWTKGIEGHVMAEMNR